MLTFTPLPSSCEPLIVAKVRATLDASDHPDRCEIGAALDVLAHALKRIEELAANVVDANAREALIDETHGVAGGLHDACGDLRYAIECWMEDRQK